MPPTKAPVKPKDTSSAAILAVFSLFQQNLAEMIRWYRGASDSGHMTGHIVIQELVLANVSLALELAIKGERWEKPQQSP